MFWLESVKDIDLTHELILENVFVIGMASKGAVTYAEVKAMDIDLYDYARIRGVEICKALGLLKKD